VFLEGKKKGKNMVVGYSSNGYPSRGFFSSLLKKDNLKRKGWGGGGGGWSPNGLGH